MEAVRSHGATPDPMSDPARPPRRGSNLALGAADAVHVRVDGPGCPCCGGRFPLMALIEHAETVRRTLRHRALPAEGRCRTARAPPRRPQAAIVAGDPDAP